MSENVGPFAKSQAQAAQPTMLRLMSATSRPSLAGTLSSMLWGEARLERRRGSEGDGEG